MKNDEKTLVITVFIGFLMVLLTGVFVQQKEIHNLKNAPPVYLNTDSVVADTSCYAVEERKPENGEINKRLEALEKDTAGNNRVLAVYVAACDSLKLKDLERQAEIMKLQDAVKRMRKGKK